MSDLARYGSCTLEDDGCVTCGDTSVPVRVRTVANGEAEVEDRVGANARVPIDFVPDARPGDILLVHVGVAMSRIESER